MKHVVVIDDDKDFLEILTLILEDAGYSVRAESKADGILDDLIKRKPDAIIVDYRLPGTDGITFTQLIKNHPVLSDTPVILMSAHRQTNRNIEKFGADYFLGKPFNANILLQKLHSFFVKD